MALFDHGDLTGDEAVNEVLLAYHLGNAAEYNATLPVIDPFPLPTGWRSLSDTEVADHFDTRFTVSRAFALESPLLGVKDRGLEVVLYIEEDDQGLPTRLSVTWVGTNAIVDIFDYLVLNEGSKLAASMEPFLVEVMAFADHLGLTNEDILVTGYSLGAAMTNIMARYKDTLADGFFVDADYIGHAVPFVHDDPDVYNFGYENDLVHRIAGQELGLLRLLKEVGVKVQGRDLDYDNTTDNVVMFNERYADDSFAAPTFGLFNLRAWSAHISGLNFSHLPTIAGSAFYDLTNRDSLVIVSNLNRGKSETYWVEDKASAATRADDYSGFVIGTGLANKLADGKGNDFLDAGEGKDHIRLTLGYDEVEGGKGIDTVHLSDSDITAYRLSDGDLMIHGDSGLKRLHDVEFISLGSNGDNLTENRQAVFALKTERAKEGTDGDDTLKGAVLFGGDGNDILKAGAKGALLHGGDGQDRLEDGRGDDQLYGAAHDDILIHSRGNDLLNGGHGNDIFAFAANASGEVRIEDFGRAFGETDFLLFAPDIFSSLGNVLDNTSMTEDGLLIQSQDLTIILDHADIDAINAQTILFGEA
ncbi:hypothetical protein PB2503_12689 [Parvularcula bermudensis HTCC2503]|uniref:Triacylglycerol lipase n=1 Tax=Parvularcula bermudensis (strain ATCC BAA-594 / HTCC2503 / KCTC 12087) TaxID=314260 RepID=E0TFL5_PARBH|nr:calcium-binding protein [Parvularcula bermudensis]ADM10575.1 hypothetical protein PB2503_12689 [Parvularcula bermudensis HTCC2503]